VIVRFFQLLIGIPLLVAGFGLAIIAAVGASTEKSDRTIAIVWGVFAFVLIGIGFLLCKSRPRIPMPPVLAQDGTSPLRHVTIHDNGTVAARLTTIDEARSSLHELRMVKKAFAIQKRAILDQQKAIRASYTDRLRRRSPKFRGSGPGAKFLRDQDTDSRAAARNHLAEKLKPLEVEKQRLQASMMNVDMKISEIQAFLG
jgi:hypothetical protein